MDSTNVRPRYFGGHRKINDAPSSASSHEPVAVVLREQALINELTAGHSAPVSKLDFAAGAKAYKKYRTRSGIFRGLKIAASISMVLVVVMGGFGYWLNHKYAGRALPFSYVGGMSVGGLRQAEIKQALDNRTKELKVTFLDGGLTRTVPASTFGATFDTEAASKQIIPDFNPFAFLDRRSVEIPVTIKDYQVDGYMRINIHPGQTKPSDATIVKEKTKLAVKQQVLGFRSDPKFAAESIRRGLAGLESPVINVNAVTLKPTIAATDLNDDVARANKLLSTNVSIAYGYSMNVVTPAQKMSWMQFDTSGGKDIQINFSRSLVRQFVVDLAKKYQKPVPVLTEAVASTESAAVAAPVTPRESIDNIEQVTDAIVAGLNSGQATASKFVASKQTAPQPVSSASSNNASQVSIRSN